MGDPLYAVLLLFAGLIGSVVLYWVYHWLLKRAEKTESKIDDILVAATGKPLIITILVVTVYLAIVSSGIIPPKYEYILDSKYLNAFYIIIGAWVASSFSYNFIHLYGRWMAARTESEVDDRIIDVLEIAVKYVIWFIAFLLILSTLDIDITPLLAGAGIAGVAVALAAQDLLSNFFGGALIVMDKPFKMGDRIKDQDRRLPRGRHQRRSAEHPHPDPRLPAPHHPELQDRELCDHQLRPPRGAAEDQDPGLGRLWLGRQKSEGDPA
jgi:small-conductance mechanosensitive channel